MKDKDFLESLGLKLRKIRNEQGMSQVDVCSRLNMDKTYLSAIENGRQNPSMLTIKNVLEAMGADPETVIKLKN